MKKAKKRRGMHPGVAVVFLVVAVGVAGKAFLGGRDAPASAPAAAAPAASAPVAEPATDGAVAPSAEAVQWRDLLAVYGSYARGTEVRAAFSTVAGLEPVAAAPGGEVRPDVPGRWLGADPPAIHVGVVMISAASRRAVIDGRVVGIGDAIGAAAVAAIERDVVRLQVGQRTLTYDFDNEYPREFRAEQALREQERAKQAAEEAAQALTTKDDPAKAPEAQSADGKTEQTVQSVAKKLLEEGK